jgi:dephospho-CoA kinase
MFESGRYQDLDKVITVFAPENIRIQRVSLRDKHRSEKETKAIIKKQLAEEEKIKRADYVIYNDGAELVIPQVLELHHLFKSI